MEDWDPLLVDAWPSTTGSSSSTTPASGAPRACRRRSRSTPWPTRPALSLTALHLGRADVLGWSIGTTVALALAVLHPSEVRRPGPLRPLPRERRRRATRPEHPGRDERPDRPLPRRRGRRGDRLRGGDLELPEGAIGPPGHRQRPVESARPVVGRGRQSRPAGRTRSQSRPSSPTAPLTASTPSPTPTCSHG